MTSTDAGGQPAEPSPLRAHIAHRLEMLQNLLDGVPGEDAKLLHMVGVELIELAGAIFKGRVPR